MDHLNIFQHYARKELHFEDQLTRAFLILVRNIPMVQALFIDMLREEMKRADCIEIPPKATEEGADFNEILTQISSGTYKRLASGTGRLISIAVSDEGLSEEAKVKNTARNAVFDGLINYASDWWFVIENKPDANNIWIEQFSANFPSDIDVEKHCISFKWRDIISRLNHLVSANLVSGIGRNLIEDFREYIRSQFPLLNPYNRLGICGNNSELLNMRCRSIMEDLNIAEVRYHRGWLNHININLSTVKSITIYADERKGDQSWSLHLELYPGDTMNQSRNLYPKLLPEKISELLSRGWNVEPNLHFSYRASGLVWTTVTCDDIRDYIEYWQKVVASDNLNQVAKEDWNNYITELQAANMVGMEDMKLIEEKITNTNRTPLNICPGLCFSFSWTNSDAIEKDNPNNQLATEINSRIQEALSCWQETL